MEKVKIIVESNLAELFNRKLVHFFLKIWRRIVLSVIFLRLSSTFRCQGYIIFCMFSVHYICTKLTWMDFRHDIIVIFSYWEQKNRSYVFLFMNYQKKYIFFVNLYLISKGVELQSVTSL